MPTNSLTDPWNTEAILRMPVRISLTPPLMVTFRSYGRSHRVWSERFDLGSAEANGLMALSVAHKMNAEILPAQSKGDTNAE